MTKKRFGQAYDVFKKIARANKKNPEKCTELNSLKILSVTSNEKENDIDESGKMIEEVDYPNEKNVTNFILI